MRDEDAQATYNSVLSAAIGFSIMQLAKATSYSTWAQSVSTKFPALRAEVNSLWAYLPAKLRRDFTVLATAGKPLSELLSRLDASKTLLTKWAVLEQQRKDQYTRKANRKPSDANNPGLASNEFEAFALSLLSKMYVREPFAQSVKPAASDTNEESSDPGAGALNVSGDKTAQLLAKHRLVAILAIVYAAALRAILYRQRYMVAVCVYGIGFTLLMLRVPCRFSLHFSYGPASRGSDYRWLWDLRGAEVQYGVIFIEQILFIVFCAAAIAIISARFRRSFVAQIRSLAE